jgi:hypothetical protein
MKELMKKALDKLLIWWEVQRKSVATFFAVLVIGLLGLEIGFTKGQALQSKPLTIKVPQSPPAKSPFTPSSETKEGSVLQRSPSNNAQSIPETCVFVGSKNSTKYHAPNCSFAKRIKAENRVCFASEDDAKAKGYIAGCMK